MEETIDLTDALEAPPVFIVGAHRSGTTWAYDLVASHPEVAGVFESGLFSADLGVAPLFSPAHWYESDEVLERDREFFGAQFRLNQLLEREDALDDVRRLTSSWLSRALGPTHRYVVEKTPQHLFTMPLINELLPGAAFVHIIRDGRDVAASVKAASTSWPRGRIREANLRAVAGSWRTAIETARRSAEDNALRYLEVRFEELRHAPEPTLAGVFEFCRIPASPERVSAAVVDSDLERRRAQGGDAFRRKGESGSWREDMGLRERMFFDRAAGELLVSLGYAADRRWWLRSH